MYKTQILIEKVSYVNQAGCEAGLRRAGVQSNWQQLKWPLCRKLKNIYVESMYSHEKITRLAQDTCSLYMLNWVIVLFLKSPVQQKFQTPHICETMMQFSEGWPLTHSAATWSFNLHLNHWQMWHWLTEIFNSLRLKTYMLNINFILHSGVNRWGPRGPPLSYLPPLPIVLGCYVKSGHSLGGGDPFIPSLLFTSLTVYYWSV